MPHDNQSRAGSDVQQSLIHLISAVVEDEFNGLKGALKVLESSILAKIDEIDKKTTKSADALKKDLMGRIEEIASAGQKMQSELSTAQKSLDNRMSASQKEFSEKTVKDHQQLDATVEKIHQDVINEMAFAQTRIDQQLASLRTSLQNDGAQIQFQANEIKRISTVLGGFARIFSDPAAPTPTAAQPAAPAPQPVPASVAKPIMMPTDSGKKEAAKQAKVPESDLPSSHDLSNQIDSIFNIEDK